MFRSFIRRFPAQIIGALLLVIFFSSAARAFLAADSRELRDDAVSRSDAALTQAMEYSCIAIAEAKLQCAKEKDAACDDVQSAIAEHESIFGHAWQDHCEGGPYIPAPGTVLSSGEIVESETGIPEAHADVATEPLFRDDAIVQ